MLDGEATILLLSYNLFNPIYEEYMAISHRYMIKTPFLLLSMLLLSSCSGSLTSSLIRPALENMQQQSDVELVCEGTPAYLLMLDSLIASEPDNQKMLQLGAKAYSSFIGAMKECSLQQKRIQTMAEKAHLYGQKLLATKLPISPGDSLEDLSLKLSGLDDDDVPTLFWGTFAWITWIQQQKGAPGAMAGLSKIEQILLRLIELDEAYQAGAAHFFLGGYYGSRPKMFGGDPEKGKYHLEKALMLSKRKMLIYQTTYAQTLARITLDQKLHDDLLNEVLTFQLHSFPEKYLANSIAQKRATRLLEEEFFKED